MRNVEDVTTVDVVSAVKACRSTQGLGVTLILAGQVYDGSASYQCGSKAQGVTMLVVLSIPPVWVAYRSPCAF